MNTIQAIFQYAYLFIAVFFGYTAYKEYAMGSSRYWIFILLALAATGMFFFKKYIRDKYKQ